MAKATPRTWDVPSHHAFEWLAARLPWITTSAAASVESTGLPAASPPALPAAVVVPQAARAALAGHRANPANPADPREAQRFGELGSWRAWRDWIEGRWQVWGSWATYEWRSRPGVAVSLWLTGGVDRLLGMFDRDREGPMLGAAKFGVLTAEPVIGTQSSGYGYRVHPITRRRKFHKGVDYKAKRGTSVYAAGPGVVTVARRRGSYGRLVVISHGMGLETRYAHLHSIEVDAGQFVPAGTLIATVGSTGRSTGPHLHFEVRQFGEPVDPHWALGIEQPDIGDGLLAMFAWLTPG